MAVLYARFSALVVDEACTFGAQNEERAQAKSLFEGAPAAIENLPGMPSTRVCSKITTVRPEKITQT